MTKRTVSLFVAACLLAGFSSRVAAQEEPLTCDDYRCKFQERLQAECECTAQSNHGRYVSCVAHLIKDLVEKEGMPVNCKGKLQRCAARSVCGKQDRGFHTCTKIEAGTCENIDTVTLQGTCSNDPLKACTAATVYDDCIISQRCKITRHPDSCAGDGLFLDLAPTCCSKCVVEVPVTPVQ